MRRETEERKKGTRMSRGLNAFVEGKTWLDLEDAADREVSTTKVELDRRTSRPGLDHLSSSSNEIPETPSNLQSPGNVSGVVTQSGATSPSQGEAQLGQVYKEIDIQQRMTFSRAAKLLKESLDLKHGGVVFLDTVVGFSAGDDDTSEGSSSSTDDIMQHDTAKVLQKGRKLPSYNETTFQSSSIHDEDPKKAGVLGRSTEHLTNHANMHEAPAFTPLSEQALQQLIKRYPRGKLWSFDEEGSLSSSEEELRPGLSHKTSEKASLRRQRRKMEAKALQGCFPLGICIVSPFDEVSLIVL